MPNLMAAAARGVMKGVSTSMWRLKNWARRPSMADAAVRMLVLCSCLTYKDKETLLVSVLFSDPQTPSQVTDFQKFAAMHSSMLPHASAAANE